MTGYPDNNFPAFIEATTTLRSMGYKVISPHEFGVADGTKEEVLRRYATRDLAAVLWLRPELGDFLVVLPGWEHSKGARTEVFTAQWVSLPVYSLEFILNAPTD